MLVNIKLYKTDKSSTEFNVVSLVNIEVQSMDYLKEFNSLLQNLDRSKSVAKVFDDFLSLATLSLAQPFYPLLSNKNFRTYQ